MSVLGMLVSAVIVAHTGAIYPELDRGIYSGRRSLWWSRDEVGRNFHRVILFRSVQACFLWTVAEDKS